MREREDEAEGPAALLAVDDLHGAGREQARQPPAAAEDLQEIVPAAEDQRAIVDSELERHADAAPDILLEPRRALKSLGRMHRLREAAGAGVEPGPDLPADGGILGHGDGGSAGCAVAQRQRAADEARELCHDPARGRQRRLGDTASVEHSLAGRQPLGEAAAHGRRQRQPVPRPEQTAEARVAQRVGLGAIVAGRRPRRAHLICRSAGRGFDLCRCSHCSIRNFCKERN